MSDSADDSEEGLVMEFDPKLKEAALAVIRSGIVQDEPVAIDGYPGMWVAKSGNPNMQAFNFLTHEEIRYAVGSAKE